MFKLEHDFINSDGKIIKNEELSYINKGANASVWKYRKMAFKIFFEDSYRHCLTYQTYERMKDLPLKNMIKAIDVYFKDDKSMEERKNFDAYLMNYLEENLCFLLSDFPLDSLLENIFYLEKDIEIITDYHILMSDVKPKNSIICNNSDMQLYITDVDKFSCQDQMKVSTLLRKNRLMLLYLIKSHFIKDLSNISLSEEKKQQIYTYLCWYFSPSNLRNELLVNKVEQLFCGCDSPKKYFKSR